MTGMETQESFIGEVIEIIKHITYSVHLHTIVCFNLHEITFFNEVTRTNSGKGRK